MSSKLNRMEIETWKYTNVFVRDIEYDSFYCHMLGRFVDLGWDESGSSVDTWINSYNNLAGKLFQSGMHVELMKISQNTFDLIQLDSNESYRKKKFKMDIVIEEIEDNEMQVFSGNKLVGKLIIEL